MLTDVLTGLAASFFLAAFSPQMASEDVGALGFEIHAHDGHRSIAVEFRLIPSTTVEGGPPEWRVVMQNAEGERFETVSSACESVITVLTEFSDTGEHRFAIVGLPDIPPTHPLSLADGSMVTVWGRAADRGGTAERMTISGAENGLATWARRATDLLRPCWRPEVSANQ
jgi:hypothetical protein